MAILGLLSAAAPQLQAQGRYLRKAAKKAAASVQPAPSAARKSLTAAQRAEFDSQALALQQLRREIIRMPYLLGEEDFQTQLDLLKQMGITPAPGADARTLFDQITQAQQNLAPYTSLQSFPLKFPANIPQAPLSFRNQTALAAFKQTREQGKKIFSWQAPGNPRIIYMGPAKLPSDPQHPLYACRQLANQLTKKYHSSLSAVFEIIFTSRLTPRQKLELARHLSQTAEVTGPDLVLFYMDTFKQIPAVKAQGLVLPEMGKPLLTYIRHKEAQLIETLQTAPGWTEQQANLFLDLAALLPRPESNLLLGALTYLGPAPAQWLLLHEQPSPMRQKLEEQIKQARAQGVTAKKTPFNQPVFVQVLQARIQFLNKLSIKYIVLLENLKNRMDGLSFAQKETAQTARQVPTLNNLSQALYVQAYKMRLNALYNKVHNHVEDLEAQVRSLQTLCPQIND